MRTSAVLLLIVACGSLCNAQDDEVHPPRLALKWSPTHMLFFFPSAQFALEHKLVDKFYLQYDVGFVFQGNTTTSEDYQNKRGYRAITELRYYLPSPEKIPFYLATDFYFSRINFDRSQTAGYNCDSGNCDYFQYVTYRVKNTELGPGLKFGLLLFPGWNKNRKFFFDLNAGFAYRKITYDFSEKPSGKGIELYDNTSYYSDNIFAPNESSRSQMRLVIGLRMGFRFF